MSKSETSQWPPVYPASKVERYRQLYGRRRDDLLSLVLPMGAAYDHIVESGQLTEEDLQVIVGAAAHERVLVAMNAVELLEALSDKWPDRISRSIVDLFSSAKAHARFAAACALTKHTDAEVVRDVIRRGLKDKGAQVRWKAAEQAESFNLRDLLPELAKALAAEKNARSRTAIAWHINILRDGYVCKDNGDGTVFLTVRTSQGYPSRIIDSEVVRERGIQTVVAEIRGQR